MRIRKENEQATRTHKLETAEGGTCQDTERNRAGDVHSLPGDGRGRDLSGHENKPSPSRNADLLAGDDRGRGLSGHGKKLTDRGALTAWRRQRKRIVSI